MVNMTPVTIPRCTAEWPEKVQAAARRALRAKMADMGGGRDILKSNTSADALVEQVWNAIVSALGHDDLAQSDRGALFDGAVREMWIEQAKRASLPAMRVCIRSAPKKGQAHGRYT